MAKVTGIGGIFLKTDPAATRQWLADNLGIESQAWGKKFSWLEPDAPHRKGATVLSFFAKDSAYFGPSTREVMLNFRVDDLDGMLASLREKGVEVLKTMEEFNGKFAHVRGPDGLTLELWEPAPEVPPNP